MCLTGLCLLQHLHHRAGPQVHLARLVTGGDAVPLRDGRMRDVSCVPLRLHITRPAMIRTSAAVVSSGRLQRSSEASSAAVVCSGRQQRSSAAVVCSGRLQQSSAAVVCSGRLQRSWFQLNLTKWPLYADIFPARPPACPPACLPRLI